VQSKRTYHTFALNYMCECRYL